MKKLIIILTITLFVIFSVPVCAGNTDNTYEKAIENIISEKNINFEDIKEYPFETIMDIIRQSVKNATQYPFVIFGKIAAVIIFSSMINYFAVPQAETIVPLINIVSIMIILNNVFQEFIQLTDKMGQIFFEVKNFIISFLPVFAGVSFASGEMITSTVYTGFFMVCVVTLANFIITYIMPSLNLFAIIGITTSLTSVVNLKPVCEFYSKAVKMSMTASVSILCFMLSLQTTITQGQDTLAVKTGKMLITSAVPVIGSALQGAVSSVYASMAVLKGFFGIAGIAVVLNIFLPGIVKLIVYWCGYFVLIVLSSIMENKTVAGLLTVFKDVVEIILSVTVLFMILLLFSLSIMIKMFQGV